MAAVTISDDPPPGEQPRPWPAPGADVDWWRGESEPADREQTTAGEGEAAADASPDEPAARTGPYETPPRPAGPRPPAEPRRPDPPPAMPLMRAEPLPVPALAPPEAGGAGEPADSGPLATRVPPQRIPPGIPPALTRPARRHHSRELRGPWLAVPGLLVVTILATFFGWVAAEPFWLAAGHGHHGRATVLAAGPGCRASFTADDATFTAAADVAGIDPASCPAGAVRPAWMVSAGGSRVYLTDARGLAVRWGVGFGLVLVCALAAVWVTGATRFAGWRRGVATALTLAAPIVLAAAMVASAY